MIEDFFTDTLTVKQKANGRAANAGFSRSETTEADGVPCMVMDNAGGQQYIGGSRGAINDHPIVTNYADVANGDTVVITVNGISVTCRINGVNQRRGRGAGIDTFFVLDVQEIEN